jgi:hypothetical protein
MYSLFFIEYQIKANKMGRTYSTFGIDEKSKKLKLDDVKRKDNVGHLSENNIQLHDKK